MTPVSAVTTISPTKLAAALLESDSAYFEAGARQVPIPGATVSLLAGLETMAAGCVVHRVREPSLPRDREQWLDEVEALVASLGAARVRLYLQEVVPRLEAVLRARGYRSRGEIGLLRPAALPVSAESPRVTLEPVVDERGWEAKLQLHLAATEDPDGYRAGATAWVAMERAKASTGFMTPWLVRREGRVCGAFATATCGGLLRLKNLITHPRDRGQGVTRAAVTRAVSEIARPTSLPVGCFSVDRGPGMSVYRSCGFEVITSQVEWVRELRP